ncbi:MAG TPA: serine protease [Caulobacteraceae bacterium]|nr:serine protease [Caulobacteraceae bacterium]
MHFPKLPDWGVYAAVVFALLVAALSRGERADAPPAPPPPAPGEGAVLRAATPFDPSVVIKAPPPPSATRGTAFALGAQGVWLSAAHVLEGCTQAALLVAPGRGVVAQVRLDPNSDVAVLTTIGGAEPLPSGLNLPLRVGARGFHPGFPQGKPGEATSRLLGRQTLVMRRGGPVHSARPEPVMAWAEAGRTDGLRGGLAGLSGAPVLDASGRVVGVTIAEAARRGRIYTVAPEALSAALRRAGMATPAPVQLGEPITVENYGRAADALRRDLRVAQVACLKRGA